MSKQRPKNKPKTTTAAPSGAPRVSPMLLWAGFTLVILAAMGLYAFFGGRGGEDTTAVTPYPMEISVQEAAAKRDAGAFILDVREQFEWDDYHIPRRNPDSPGGTGFPRERNPRRPGDCGGLPLRQPQSRRPRHSQSVWS
jgi:hypothetical protein